MRDTGDMMEDAFSEDTMMECSGDDAGLDDLIDLTDDVSNSAPTIIDAAERLLTLLGVENGDHDDLSSSEDEGVELDEDSDDNDEGSEADDDETKNTRLLHQLAISLAQELKYSQKQGSKTSTRISAVQRGAKSAHHEINRGRNNDQVQCMEVAHDICYQDDSKAPYKTSIGRGFFGAYEDEDSAPCGKYPPETRLPNVGLRGEEKKNLSVNSAADSWAIGWDACAAEAIRYLVEDEGLSPHHPTVLAMKCHLEIQRERASAHYSV